MTTIEIKERNPIEAVIGRAVKLSPKSGLLFGQCPFHSEKSASFSVTPSRQIFKCFGCGATGDVITFVMLSRNISFREAKGLLSADAISDFAIPLPPKPPPPKPLTKEMREGHERLFEAQKDSKQFALAAKNLGVSTESLQAIRAAFSSKQNAWMFPLRNHTGEIMGFRFRDVRGNKWSLTGGHEGLIMPGLKIGRELAICEGPTDLAALITLGITSAIARPSAFGAIQMTCDFAKRMRVRSIIICVDNDLNGVGLDGAKKLARMIHLPCKFWIPSETKDVRSFLNAGGTLEQFRSMLNEE